MKNKTLIIIYIVLFLYPAAGRCEQKKTVFGRVEPIEKSATLPTTSQNVAEILSHPNQIHISEKEGIIKETWMPQDKSDAPIILHIQDAHCNYEAQTNINLILSDLMKQYPDQIRLIAVEGSVGLIDTTPFAEFSDTGIKKEVADYFMKKGKITGPEFLSITGPYKFTIYGIEDKDLYDKNYKAFLDSLPFREESGRYCGYLSKIFAELKKHIYTDELKKYDKFLEEHKAKEEDFIGYVDGLKKYAGEAKLDLRAYPDFKLLLDTQTMEKGINFTAVENERNRLIDKLSGVLDKQGVSELILKSMHFKTGKINSPEYYGYLKQIAEIGEKKNEIKRDEYANLFLYIDYLGLHEKIDMAKLFEQSSLLEDNIGGSMFKDDSQRQLFKMSKDIYMLERMFTLELTKDEYHYYKSHKEDFLSQHFLSFINAKAPLYGITVQKEAQDIGKIDKELPVVEEFYDAAITRDPVLVGNMLSEMEREGVKVSVLITGGFHTRGITDILKQKGLSYAVISPKITKQPEYNPYIDIMTNKKTPFEEFLEQTGEEE